MRLNSQLPVFAFIVCHFLLYVTSQVPECPPADDRCTCRFADDTYGDVIDCQGLELISVPEFLPSNFTWDSLILQNNLLFELPDESFQNIQVRSLYLGNNIISTLGQDVFASQEETLELIDLTENRLVTREISSIHDLPLLETLILDFNLITELDDQQLIGLPSLDVLQLQFNNIAVLTQAYTINVPTITDLDVYANGLLSIDDDALSHLTNLESLEFGINSLNQIPTPIFEGLNQLQRLSLWTNGINEIGENDLATMSPMLQQLNLGNNAVSELPEGLFSNFPNLFNLGLSFMNLNSLPERIFENTTSLSSVQLDGNAFTEIPPALNTITNLNNVGLSYNLITSVGGDDLESPGLAFLSMDNNLITSFNQSLFCNKVELTLFSLRENAISDFDACALLTIDGARVDLAGNPLNCGCDVLWLKQAGVIENPEETFCASPPELAGRPISDVTDEEFQCDLDAEEACSGICQ